MTIKILSSSSVLPKRIVTNFDLAKQVDTSDEWIQKMTGIRQRHILSEDETFLDCTVEAARLAIEKAKLSPEDIDAIVISTSTPWQIMPSTAAIVQGLLGITQCIAFDLQAACGGFMYALYNAWCFMQADKKIRRTLVMGCEALSKVIDWRDRTTCVLFGDGFGALVLERDDAEDGKGILHCTISCDGAGRQDLEVPWGIGRGYAELETANRHMLMNGREVYKNSVNYFVSLIKDTLAENNLQEHDIAWVIPHQANIRIIHAVAERMNIPHERFVITLQQHGNTSAASIPLAFDSAVKSNKISAGDLVLLVGFGAGYTWGTALISV
ncbi:MAG TPA: beta-ketoacyl-ACP synthase III [Gammaproteobacteria bacterium]|nr:beta-ketoacyl-ACP synthase III [Gammaproteobacteria bacterium]